ncbi:hypothetical protein FPOAC2_03919 [Fusarium poae]|uniref:hypothetical protein n=1 Tax=Fusarium poae TaxID=36050 RepID=UPI001CE7F797|nr:hypothetical protein FPOAC1_003805 [Fusarium poae]KAG8677777.1 hypothetical protein FPOAC1_003805 [Fusarium poae]
MYSPAKLFVAAMALTTFASASPVAEKSNAQSLEARGSCFGYANYAACASARRRSCPHGVGQNQCFTAASRACQENC